MRLSFFVSAAAGRSAFASPPGPAYTLRCAGRRDLQGVKSAAHVAGFDIFQPSVLPPGLTARGYTALELIVGEVIVNRGEVWYTLYKGKGGRMMESAAGIGTILLIILIGGGGLVALGYIVRAALRVGNLATMVARLLKQADYEAETTPKSLSSAEPLLMDRIRRDFPEYNPELIRQRVAADAKTFYESARAGRCLYKEGVSDQLKERLESFLPPDVAGSIRVYKVALSAYDDVSEDRVLTFQAAASFKDPADTTRQRRLILKYLAAWSTDTMTGVKKANCPNCGAPIPAVGSKVCKYCGTALKVWAGTQWLLTDIRED